MTGAKPAQKQLCQCTRCTELRFRGQRIGPRDMRHKSASICCLHWCSRSCQVHKQVAPCNSCAQAQAGTCSSRTLSSVLMMPYRQCHYHACPLRISCSFQRRLRYSCLARTPCMLSDPSSLDTDPRRNRSKLCCLPPAGTGPSRNPRTADARQSCCVRCCRVCLEDRPYTVSPRQKMHICRRCSSYTGLHFCGRKTGP